MEFVDVLSRWVHVGTAITVLGGSVFLRFVLQPAAAQLPEEPHNQLRGLVMQRWRRIVQVGILLFLLSGFYNYLGGMGGHRGDKFYHMLVGTKILLAFGVFFLASVLTGRSPTFEWMRAKSKTWLAVTIGLAAIVVAISGYVKVVHPPRAAPVASPAPAVH
ncbi:hypothetical protein [Planctellipticum variicoloris]|uniref:hypothetical protein n=1 Tax=Planctellipticum variicoloris TaxID=3064265 RepID=UPI002BF9A964|nr:hypothetical protein SH412_001142 [Planctomycetaceae bacterium SH412]HTN03698.1 hypothetical protein [Planctomycetaceae bacterium]